jgi:hypothetical protein
MCRNSISRESKRSSATVMTVGAACLLYSSVTSAQPTTDFSIDMESSFGARRFVPADRPAWARVTRRSAATDAWLFLTFPDTFGQQSFVRGTILAFYDDQGTLLHVNRRASSDFAGSRLSFGLSFNTDFGAGSPIMPDVNRPYYLGIGALNTEFFPNFAFTHGPDSGRFDFIVLPSPSAAMTLGMAALFAARRRR